MEFCCKQAIVAVAEIITKHFRDIFLYVNSSISLKKQGVYGFSRFDLASAPKKLVYSFYWVF